MFIVSSVPGRARRVLGTMAELLPVPTGPVHEVEVGGGLTVSWMRAQVRDNLHVHTDGVLVGRRTPSEPLSDDPIHHDGPLPDAVWPLAAGAIIRSGAGPTVEPLGVSNVFRTASAVSDRQLLLAALEDLRPAPEAVAMIAGIGYFLGNMSLFGEVERIPFLHRWDMGRRAAVRTRDLELPASDDAAMVDRLVSLVPTDVPQSIGLSGGYDSRFVLGLLHRAGAPLRIVRFDDVESDVVNAVAAELGIEVTTVGAFFDAPGARSPLEFALLSDGQIWHGVSQHARLRAGLAGPGHFHSGQFSDSICKNAFKTAWKKPDPRPGFRQRLVQEVFVSPLPAEQPTLRSVGTREELAEVVTAAVAPEWEYLDLRSRKQQANWLYYMNRAMRWAQAFHDDVAFSTHLVFLLSDIDAQLLGLTSGAWANFRNDRVARLNHQLLPTVRTGYHSGGPVVPTGGLGGAVGKLQYEYLTRLQVRRRQTAVNAANPTTWTEDLPDEEPTGWDALFDRPMAEGNDVGGRFGIRRARVTVAQVLTFLDRARSDLRSVDGADGRP